MAHGQEIPKSWFGNEGDIGLGLVVVPVIPGLRRQVAEVLYEPVCFRKVLRRVRRIVDGCSGRDGVIVHVKEHGARRPAASQSVFLKYPAHGQKQDSRNDLRKGPLLRQ